MHDALISCEKGPLQLYKFGIFSGLTNVHRISQLAQLMTVLCQCYICGRET